MAAWVVGYGIVQASAPRLASHKKLGQSAARWVGLLALVTAMLSTSISLDFYPVASIFVGLGIFGIIFAMNSAIHSYLILAFTSEDQVALNVGFYYMANAWGRLVGTLLSGLVFIFGGLAACLWTSAIMLIAAFVITLSLKLRS